MLDVSTKSAEQSGVWISDEEFKALDQLVGKLPTNIGIYFVDFFRQIQQNRAAEKAATLEKVAPSEPSSEPKTDEVNPS